MAGSWSAIAQARTPVRLAVIEASGVTGIDYTGANVLRQVVETLQSEGDPGCSGAPMSRTGTNTPHGQGC